jgi:hypothetical protein
MQQEIAFIRMRLPLQHKWLKKNIQYSNWMFVVVSALLTILAYGLLAGELGMYGDDPNFLWAYHRGGAAEFRPFMAWIRDFGYLVYQFLSPLFGENIIGWRLALLLLRWTSGLLYYFTLCRRFPAQKPIIWWAALLFLFYPGFLQQAIPVEFILHFISLNFILASILLMQLAFSNSRGKWLLLIGSFGFEVIGLFLCEYFISLELVRPFLVSHTMTTDTQNSSEASIPLKKKGTHRNVLPLLISFIIFLSYLIWRGFFASSSYVQPVFLSALKADAPSFLLTWIEQAGHDLILVLIKAWGKIFSPLPSGRSLLVYAGITALSFLICALSSFINRPTETDETYENSSLRPLILLGLFAVISGGIPVWAAGLKTTLSLFWDRLTLSFMWGACLTFTSVFGILIRKKYQPLLFSLIIALTVGFQFQLQNQFRRDWQLTQNYFWQLHWRAPDLAQGTLVLGDQFPFSAITDNSLNALLNWNYEEAGKPMAENYKFFQVSARRNLLIEPTETNQIIHNNFSGNLDQSIVVYATPSTCLKVLTKTDRELPFLGYDLRQVLHYSNPDQILVEPARTVTLQSFMGPEPVHDWCYYYEKGELAEQQEQWDKVLELGIEAESLGLSPTVMVEMRPFLFAALLSNDIPTASRWANKMVQEQGNAAYFLRWFETLEPSSLNQEALILLNQLKTDYQKERDLD